MPRLRRERPRTQRDPFGRPLPPELQPGARAPLYVRRGTLDRPTDNAESTADADATLEARRDAERDSVAAGVDAEIFGDLDDLVDAVAELTPGDAARLQAFWKGIDPGARSRAHEHAREAADATDRIDLIRTLQAEVVQWATGEPRRATAYGEGWFDLMFDPGRDPIRDAQGRGAAVPALLDAVLALALQDGLDGADFDTLFGPWTNAMGDGGDGGDGDDAAEGRDAAEDRDDALDRADG